MLTIDNLTVRYPGTRLAAVNGVSLQVNDGESMCIVGESGSGKSTLALASMRLLADGAEVEGSVRLDGKSLLEASPAALRQIRGRDIGFVFQDALSSFSAYWTVGEQISETIRAHTNATRRQAWEQTVAQLAKVQIQDPERVARSYPHELSGGQRQRAALAMALALKPRLLIADEPTSALDVTTAAHLLALIKQLQAELNISVLLITHDIRVVEAIADRLAVMYGGVLGEIGDRASVLARPRYPYTRALINSLDLSQPRGRLMGVPGAPPGLSEPIAGCPFAPRCPLASDVCASEPPPLDIGLSRVRCHHPIVHQEMRGRG